MQVVQIVEGVAVVLHARQFVITELQDEQVVVSMVKYYPFVLLQTQLNETSRIKGELQLVQDVPSMHSKHSGRQLVQVVPTR